MDKIDRYPVIINVPIIPKATVGYIETKEEESPYYCKVLKKDLDAQEAYIKQLEEEKDDFKNKLSAMTAHRSALKEEISGLHKYINKLHTELNKPPLFKNQLPQEKE